MYDQETDIRLYLLSERKIIMKTVDNRKVAIIGCGFVGSSSAFALMQSGLFSEIALVDVDRNRAEGEALDISHGVPFVGQVKVYASDYDGIMDAGIIVITAGAAQKPGETRLDLVNKNVGIYKSIIPEIAKRHYKGILLIVSNPVDILTYAAIKISGFPEKRVLGSGTVLDTARLKSELGEHLSVDGRSVHSFIIGEHGDSEIVAWNVKNSAYEIIEKKKATYYGIAMSVVRICRAIVMNERSILPVSSILHGEYGIHDIALSMPAVIGEEGVETQVPIVLSEEEQAKLQESAEALKQVAEQITF